MLFNSAEYLAFLLLVVLVAWRLSPPRRPAFLLIASYAFYAAWSPPFLLLIVGLTALNFLIGLAQDGLPPLRSRSTLAAVLVLNLGALALFKYLGLFDETARSVASALGLPYSLPAVQVALPLGLSFFVFEFIHYQVDIFRGDRPIRDPIRFALFPAFFPTQIAGPIKRYQDFDRQVRDIPRFDPELFVRGAELIALGLFKKVVLADALLPIADSVFSDPMTATRWDAWLGTLAFSFQIYMDFSGYTDIGRGSAQLLGYTVPVNFRSPYLAVGLRDFWRRWHISLSSWLRDYLYIPLGGSRHGARRTTTSIMVTMALGGLWHGPAWHFLLWGLGHGLGMAAGRAMTTVARVPSPVRVAGVWLATQVAVLFLWVMFRASNAGDAVTLWSRLLVGEPGTALGVSALPIAVAAGVLVAELIPVGWRPLDIMRAVRSPLVRPLYVSLLGGAVALAVSSSGATHRFIYFQF